MADALVTKSQLPSGDPEMKGWLFKWTNYLKGYQRRWFVLSNGLLSYYRNQAEMAHTCRGTISLLGALIHTVDSCTFVISNGGTQTFHIKAASEVERQNWVTALELAKAKAIRATESDDDDVNSVGNGGMRGAGTMQGNKITEDAAPRELAVRLDDLRTCAELVARHGAALQRALAELDLPQSEQMRQASERATLFRIACNAMMNASADFLQVAQSAGVRWGRILQHERDQKTRLQEVVEQLARQHDTLEKSVSARATSQPSESTHDTDDEEHEFFDAQDGGSFSGISTGEQNSFIIKIPIKANRKNSAYNESSEESEPDDLTETQVLFVQEEQRNSGVQNSNPTMSPTATETEESTEVTDCASGQLSRNVEAITIGNHHDAKEYKVWPHPAQLVQIPGVKSRRTRVADKPNYTLNLWSILKNCIGKELTKIPIPVNFSEPLSMLQRLTEDYEYSYILDMAARCSDPCEQLAYVTAFTVSSYATTAYRTAKPFNPMLGETYECDRMTDLGWRSISEQVSHHPPMLAQYCEGVSGWKCWQEFTFTSKFRGKYIQVIPLGSATAEFVDSGNKYSWRKVTTTVHNVIVGKLWVDQHGDMDIIGEGGNANGVKAHIKYLPYSYFSKDAQKKVTGVVKNAYGQPKWVIQGYWDKRVEIAPVTGTNSDSSVCKTGKFTTVWEKVDPAPDSERYYNYTILAAQLNEIEDGVAPTDSRCRPDQRLMEEGLWDEANSEKLRLEEEQRTRRRALEATSQDSMERGLPPPAGHSPVWFTRRSVTDSPDAPLRHVFNGDYWECKSKQDWSKCPQIF